MAKKKKTRHSPPPIESPRRPRWHAAPLKSSFMATAILGFLISAYWVYPQSFNYGIAFMAIFAIMFIASIVSMTKAPVV